MIRIDGVTKKYGKVTAVNDLSLDVHPGEVFGFLGPNGAGKTTTLKMLAGLLTPTAGSLYVDGRNVEKEPMEAKMVSGYVPDKPFIYEKLTGREFLEFVRELYRVHHQPETDQIQERLISMFLLNDWLDEMVESYSHGMRQKLIITSALIHRPKALIIDEPMVGLDAKGMRQVKGLFRELADSGSTVMLSTHTMAIAQDVCDRIGILSKGNLMAVGSMDELRAQTGAGADDDLETIFLAITDTQGSEEGAA